MKNKLIIIVALSFITCLVTAQSLYVPGGTSGIGSSVNSNIGIGTTSPQKNLDVITGNNNFVSFGYQMFSGNYAGIHFGYLEPGSAQYRKSALVFERVDGAARGKVHILNNGGNDNSSATLTDSKMTIDYNGNIGLGTISPATKLDVNGGISIQSNNNVTWGGAYGPGIPTIAAAINNGIYFYPAGSTSGASMNIDRYGNIGIGTTTATGILNVKGAVGDSNTGDIVVQGAPGGAQLRIGVNTDYAWIQSHGSRPLTLNELGNNTFLNPALGNVGIGTTNPDSKLTVNGTIHSKQVKIDLTVPGPDYVFAKDYNLPSLEQIKSYIDQNKHLPEVPSAKEMEANGVNVGEMNMLLLKKVEELTLHLIEMKEENQQLKARIEKIENRK